MNYLYSGVPLPDIYSVYTPEVQELNPFAVIVRNNSTGDYFLMADDETFTANSDGDTVRPFPGVAYALENEEWVSSAGRINCKAIWANHNILNEDGTLYLAASDPVPVQPYTPNPAAMLMGFQLGAAIRRMRGMKQPEQPPVQTIVGYRYGDSPVLPEIPKAEGFEFEYLQYSDYTPDQYFLALSTEEVVNDGARVQGNGAVKGYVYTDDQALAELWGGIANEWIMIAEMDTTDLGEVGANQILWTSHDILNADGSIYLAASEPVPVYE